VFNEKGNIIVLIFEKNTYTP